jgi:hypothetical protein
MRPGRHPSGNSSARADMSLLTSWTRMPAWQFGKRLGKAGTSPFCSPRKAFLPISSSWSRNGYRNRKPRESGCRRGWSETSWRCAF